MNIIISNNSDIPLYKQIKDQIKDSIFTGDLAEGSPMPSIRIFANELNVSILTIRRVYDELEAEGFVSSQIGKGTFVSTGNLELLLDSKRRIVEKQMQDMLTTAKTLQISKEELIDMINILYEE